MDNEFYSQCNLGWKLPSIIEENENEKTEAEDNISAVGELLKRLHVTNTTMREYERCNPLWGLTNTSPLARTIMRGYENNMKEYEMIKDDYQFYANLLTYHQRCSKKGLEKDSSSTDDWGFWQEYKNKVLKFYTALLLASVDDEDLFKPKGCDKIVQWISTNFCKHWTKRQAHFLYRTVLKCWDSFHRDFGMYDGSDALSTDGCKKQLKKILKYGKDSTTNLVLEEAFDYIKFNIERKKYISRKSMRYIKIKANG